MTEIPENITRKELLQAIDRIDKESIPANAHSSTYDVIHEGKPYPPKLVVSWANKFANGEELDRASFAGGKDTDCFKLLEKEGFLIARKNDGLRIKLTQGAITNGYLNVRGSEEWFPANAISEDGSDPGGCIEIQTPDGSIDSTFVLKNHGRIKKRYGKLFKDLNLKEGQVVKLVDKSFGSYALCVESGEKYIDSSAALTVIKKRKIINMDNQPLNQILYGPPGTGKTYHTIDKALAILEPGIETRELGRAELKTKFDQYVEDGLIHFVTFHQSFSYEDFVEGIKATTSGEGISYTVESGIFKKACEASTKGASGLNFEDVFNQFVEDIAEKPIVLKTPRGKEFTVTFKGGNTTITCVPHASEEKRELPASMAHIKQVLRGVRPDNIYCESYVNGIANHIKSATTSRGKAFQVGQSFNGYNVSLVSEDIVQLTKPNGNMLPFPMAILNELKDLVHSGQITIEDIGNKEWRKVDSTIEPYLVNGYPNLVPLLVSHLVSGGEKTAPKPIEVQPTVLIIDEINRGNISSIFGELITLIEPSKRAGAEEALSVTLPYSKETFQVPCNLYLIGTMNTADRSLALMDTALRRRFDFVEMMPDVELLKDVNVKGIDIPRMLTIMNKRIEVLYDREHTLGHAFFMPLKYEKDENKCFELLQGIFSNKILPLLEEYFFEDWAKIRLVLGDENKATDHQFITENGKDYDAQALFGENVDLGYEIEETKSYMRNDAALAHPETYLGIYAN